MFVGPTASPRLRPGSSTFRPTPFEYVDMNDGDFKILARKGYFVVTTLGYWEQFPTKLRPYVVLIAVCQRERRVIFKTRDQLHLPVLETAEAVLLVEKNYTT